MPTRRPFAQRSLSEITILKVIRKEQVPSARDVCRRWHERVLRMRAGFAKHCGNDG